VVLLIPIRALCTFLIITLAACGAGTGTVYDKLDPLTAVTITYSSTPLIFYRDNSGRAAYAREFLYLAPLEVNRTGTFRYYVWLGIWSTLQDAGANEYRDGFESIVIYADGEPLPLALSGWTPESIGASEHIYTKPVASAADAYFEVTADQLRLIAASSNIRVQSTGIRPQNYELWDEQLSARESLRAFLLHSAF